MFGLSAKERLAQLQQKGAKDAPQVGKLSAGLKPTPGKLAPGPGQLKKPEPPKPAADLKKPVAPQPAKPKEEPKKVEPVKPKEEPKAPAVQEPAKPKEEPKTLTAPEPAKPKEEPKKPEAQEPAAKPKEEPKKVEPVKPKEEPKAPAVQEPAKPKEEPKTLTATEPAKPKDEPKQPATSEPAKPKEEPKKPAAPEPAKPKDEPKKPAAPEPAKPKEEPKKPAAPEPAKPKDEPKKPAALGPAKPNEEPKKPAAPEPAKPAKMPNDATVKAAGEPAVAKQVEEPKKPTDDFFHSIFYFSGMGTLIGSALTEGVYVPEKTQRNALDSDEIEAARERQRLRRGEEIIATARNQAQGLSTDFRHLQALLESLPTFTESFEAQPLDRRGVDQVIHGHVYFQQEHQAPIHSRPAHHQHQGLTSAAEIASHVPHHHHHQQQQHPTHVVAEAKRVPVGGVPVMPDLFEGQRNRPHPSDGHHHQKATAAAAAAAAPSFAEAIDEFDRAISASSHQQPLFAAPPPRPPSEPTRPHPRERPTPGEEHGAHAGHAPGAGVGPTQPWQERYGQTEVTKFAAPRPFSATGGEIDSKGIKSWQMSHLRTLEVKGYHIVSDSEPDSIKSYSPYLVSDRSQGTDRQFYHHHPQHQAQHRGGPSPSAAATGVEPPVSATSYKPPAATNSPFAQSIGYSDL